MTKIKKSCQKIADGIELIKSAEKENDSLKQLMIFSQDPISMIEPLITLIQDLKKVVERFDDKLTSKESEYKIIESELENENYSSILNDLEQSEKLWEDC